MRILNPRRLADGRIDANVEHPEHGWVPYTAAPDTGDEEMEAIWQQLQSAKVEPYRPTPPGKQRNTESGSVSRATLRLALTRHLGLTDAQVDDLFGA